MWIRVVMRKCINKMAANAEPSLCCLREFLLVFQILSSQSFNYLLICLSFLSEWQCFLAISKTSGVCMSEFHTSIIGWIAFPNPGKLTCIGHFSRTFFLETLLDSHLLAVKLALRIIDVCSLLDQISSFPQAVKVLYEVTCGDIQSISVLRGMAKNNTPGLIASLALWAAESYRSAAFSARSTPFSLNSTKVCQYAEFKAVFFRSYALTFAGRLQIFTPSMYRQ